jgi:hypothetical protein
MLGCDEDRIFVLLYAFLPLSPSMRFVEFCPGDLIRLLVEMEWNDFSR